ncbi:MAG: MinD/ParA family protein [Gammaproteobacteria bacterium]|nr:MinD/ParA family protein [Gammaproteobacteria bacterium]MDH4313274.1 MinD/ParA family protein [Gammaproteobacteria bacterium]MDH5212925.1 MinD/ParA family protein [Gammaproteobacteria bacterium]MDH5499468.1 MinD/ParA family protein [Gammaproteobacteria bacterium]
MEKVLNRTPAKVIAVTSGKGGVGKTNIAANVSISLAADGNKVMLLDADLGLANVDVLLGLQPKFNLSHVVSGECDLDSTVIEGPQRLKIVPASSGNFSMLDLPSASQAAIIQAFSTLAEQPDVLVVDTAAGISEGVARFVQAAQQAIVVVCDEPASLTDAYALIKVFSREYGIRRFQIVTNQTRDAWEGRILYTKLRKVADLYLDVVLRHLGNVPMDPWLRRAVQEQRAVVDAYPRSVSGQAFKDIARSLQQIPAAMRASGNIEFFLERLLAAGPVRAGGIA